MAKTPKADIVFEVLRDRILLNKMRSGEAIGEQAVAEEFGVSRTPVRQALQKLASLGLVDIRDGMGSFVTPIDLRDIEQAYQIRCALEKLALETAVYHIAGEELSRMESQFEGYVKDLRLGKDSISYDDMAFADWRFHDLIVERSENRLIQPTASLITLVLRRYQISRAEGYLRANEEHLVLIHCIRDKDVPGAQELLDEHLRVRTQREGER